MAQLLKQSTAFTFRIGPFLDDTDGKTSETGLTIAQADIQISKAGGAFAQTSASPTTTHDMDGWYQCPLTTTDTGTLGTLDVQIVISGALPVWKHFMVVPANIYDSLVLGSASDYLQVDVTQIAGAAVNTATAQLGVNAVNAGGTAWGSGAITAASIATDAIAAAKVAADAVTKIQTGLATPTNITAGVITTVTNLTNAPTNGDFTATMKTSITTAATSSTPTVTLGNVAHGGAAATLTLNGAGGLVATKIDGPQNGAVTGNITGNLSGSVGSVTGAVGSVTGAVGSVTGAVGSVTGAVGSVAANGITATSIATDAINAASVKADAVTKIQTGLATPTNITAGVITTATNLTNAPANGDFTATMKTSIGTAVAASAVASVTASVTVGTNNDKTGYALSAAGVDAVFDEDPSGHTTASTFGLFFYRMYRFFMNKMNITDATGAVALRNEADGADIMTSTITDNSTTTVRTAATWS